MVRPYKLYWEYTNTYTITLTDAQARVLAQATEILARLGIGQFRDALERLPKHEVAPEGWYNDLNAIGKLLATYMINNVDGYRSSLGIHDKNVSETSRIAWDLHQVLRHRLAWEHAVEVGVVESIDSPRKWPEMIQVNYDEPLKASEHPLAVMKKENP